MPSKTLRKPIFPQLYCGINNHKRVIVFFLYLWGNRNFVANLFSPGGLKSHVKNTADFY